MTTPQLSGKKVLVTGSTSGIGRATVNVLVADGATVFATGRNADVLATISGISGVAGVLAGDITDPEFTKALVPKAVATMGGLTSLVNCAGVLYGGKVGADPSHLDTFDKNFMVNVRAAFDMTHHAAPHLKAAGHDANPSIVNVSSVTGMQSYAGVAAYCASKAALDQLTRCSALDLAADGIRVNSVNPGVVPTEIHRRGGMSDAAYAEFTERSLRCHPLSAAVGRLPTAEEIGFMISFLLSDKVRAQYGPVADGMGGVSTSPCMHAS